jgi:hypothetical protein
MDTITPSAANSEPMFQVLGWDSFLPTLSADRRTPLGLLDVFAARGILIGSQILSIFISLIALSISVHTVHFFEQRFCRSAHLPHDRPGSGHQKELVKILFQGMRSFFERVFCIGECYRM